MYPFLAAPIIFFWPLNVASKTSSEESKDSKDDENEQWVVYIINTDNSFQK